MSSAALIALATRSRTLIAASRRRRTASATAIAESRRLILPCLRGGTGPAPSLPDLSGLTLLVAEDDRDYLEILDLFFTACGARVLLARNASTALAHLDTRTPDAIIAGLAMPSVHGVVLMRAIRSSGRHRRLPAIALIAFHEELAEARTQGFDASFRKPIDFDTMGASIRTLVDARRADEDPRRSAA